MSTAAVPQFNFVMDKQGKPLFVQLPVQDWEVFVEEFRRLAILLQFKAQLKEAFREVRQIQEEEKPKSEKNRPKFGSAKGKYRMAADFDEPLETVKDYME